MTKDRGRGGAISLFQKNWIAIKDRGREGVGGSIFSQLKMGNLPALLMSPLRRPTITVKHLNFTSTLFLSKFMNSDLQDSRKLGACKNISAGPPKFTKIKCSWIVNTCTCIVNLVRKFSVSTIPFFRNLHTPGYQACWVLSHIIRHPMRLYKDIWHNDDIVLMRCAWN